jgi:hypothetical protein
MESKHTRGRGRALWASALLALALCIFAVIPAAAGASTPKTALINGESVTFDDGIEKGGEPISLEQFAAEQDGFSVTVKSGPEWEKMTAPEFAHYQVLIVGDPDCEETALSAVGSGHVWAPVVMGSEGGGAGNRVVVGTDPEDHYQSGAQPTNPEDPTTSGAEHLVQRGIGFAGAVPGATGVYFDTSCEDPGGDVEVLNELKSASASGEWEEDPEEPNCVAPVYQIATNPAFHEGPNPLTNADITGWHCSSHVSFLSFPSDWTALAVVTPLEGEIRPTPVCGSDIEEPSVERCGSAYVLIAGKGILASAPNLSLTPVSHSSAAGPKHQHTVTANAHKEGKPIVGIPVSFVVTGTNEGVSGFCTTGKGEFDAECKTDENGDVLFTYNDVHGVGTDTIVGSITLEGEVEGGVRPATSTLERATASQEWLSRLTLEPPTGSDESGVTHQHTVTAKVKDEETPITGAVVSFNVSGTNAGVTGTCTTGGGEADPECKTDEKGEVRFTYNDVNGAGQDTINASVGIEEEEQIPEARPAGVEGVKVTTEHASATMLWIAPTPPAPPAAQPGPAAAASVLAAKSAKPPVGKASIARARGCVAQASHLVTVHGSSMQTVKFVLDGHTVKTVHVGSGATSASARVSVHAGGKHHLTIKVSFTKASGTAAKTFHQTLARCAAHVVAPRFTG